MSKTYRDVASDRPRYRRAVQRREARHFLPRGLTAALAVLFLRPGGVR